MKKILTILISACLMISCSFFTIYAGSYPDLAEGNMENAVEYLSNQGIVSGYPDGTYKPGNPVTRAEVAALSVKAFNFFDPAVKSADFPDANDHWAQAYIGTVNKLGLVTGYPDGTFKPNSIVSYSELLTIIINSMGLKSQLDDDLKWPSNYIKLAEEISLLNGLSISDWKDPANRGDVAIAFYNSLVGASPNISLSNAKAKMFRYNDKNEITYTKEFYRNDRDIINIELSLGHEVLDKDAQVLLTTNISSGSQNYLSRNHNVTLQKGSTQSVVFLAIDLSELSNNSLSVYNLSIVHNQKELVKDKFSLSFDYSYATKLAKQAKFNGLKFYIANDYVDKNDRIYATTLAPSSLAKHVWFELDSEFPAVSEYTELPINFEYIFENRTFGKHSYNYYLAPGETKPDIIGAIYTDRHIDWKNGKYRVIVSIHDKVVAEGEFYIFR